MSVSIIGEAVEYQVADTEIFSRLLKKIFREPVMNWEDFLGIGNLAVTAAYNGIPARTALSYSRPSLESRLTALGFKILSPDFILHKDTYCLFVQGGLRPYGDETELTGIFLLFDKQPILFIWGNMIIYLGNQQVITI